MSRSECGHGEENARIFPRRRTSGGIVAKGDLERVKALVDFKLFRAALETAVPRAERSKGGRPPFEHVLMFKILILQAIRSLSDERCE